jgi:hypothetical protein
MKPLLVRKFFTFRKSSFFVDCILHLLTEDKRWKKIVNTAKRIKRAQSYLSVNPNCPTYVGTPYSTNKTKQFSVFPETFLQCSVLF